MKILSITEQKPDSTVYLSELVQRCASFGEYSTRYLRQHRVAEASRRNRYAVASAPSAGANIRHSIHQNLRNAVLVKEYAAMGHEQAVMAGVYREDSVELPEGVRSCPGRISGTWNCQKYVIRMHRCRTLRRGLQSLLSEAARTCSGKIKKRLRYEKENVLYAILQSLFGFWNGPAGHIAL